MKAKIKLKEAIVKLDYRQLTELSDRILSSASYLNSTSGVLSARERLDILLSEYLNLEYDWET